MSETEVDSECNQSGLLGVGDKVLLKDISRS